MPVTINGTTGVTAPNLVGQVVFFAMQTAPAGFLACEGQAVSRTTYAALFAAVGTLYGAGDGSTTFNLPDLRAEFIRGWDNGRGVDTGRALGSAQAAAMLNHTHSGTTSTDGAHTHSSNVYVYTGSGSSPSAQGSGTSNVTTSSAGAHSHTITTGNPNVGGGTETRPRNIALLPCIQF